ncbi:MAG: histidine--tRNA ligase [Candidatus Nanoarchaeia archaeon]
MISSLSTPPGMSDIMPDEIASWHEIEEKAHSVFPLYGYAEARTPLLEYLEVFVRGIGNETDVVQKEIYSFMDKGGRTLALRPEGTAGMIRALAGTDLAQGAEKRVYYMGPMFRGERPAAGRKRQFHQVGVENAGRVHPELDVEAIEMLLHYLDEIGIEGYSLLLSTRATPEDRKPAEIALKAFFEPEIGNMCDDCRNRFTKNPWRILDCKNHKCGEIISKAPNMIEHFGDESRKYFDKVCHLLDVMGITYHVEPRLVRGLDYYMHTVFEVTHPGLGGQNAIAGGGRYSIYLPGIKKPIDGIGFAAGMERLLMARAKKETQADSLPAGSVSVYLAPLISDAIEQISLLARKIRKLKISAMAECEPKSMKSALRAANKYHAKLAVIIGESEFSNSVLLLKNLTDGSQECIPLDFASERIKNIIEKGGK